MSISSCPRCTQQVTLPVGVSNSAIVRCPLCRAEYTLADALVNMPPLLEVLDERTGEPSASWYDMTAEERTGEPSSAALDASLGADIEPTMGIEAGAPAKRELDMEQVDSDAEDSWEDALTRAIMREDDDDGDDDGDESDDDDANDDGDDFAATEDLQFEAAEFDDEIAIEQQDTEVEELSFDAIEAEDVGPSAEIEQLAVAAQDGENVLDFGEPAEMSDTPASDAPRPDFAEQDDLRIDFGEALPVEASSNEADLNFDAPPVAANTPDEFAIDFGEPEEAPAAATDATIEFNERVDLRPGEEVTFEFNRPFDQPAAEEEIALDFGDPVAPAEPAAENKLMDEATDGKKDKKKKRKEKKPRAAAGDEPRKRTVVGMLTNVVLPSILAVPLALYGALWISPDYDFFGIGPKLPGWMAPAKFSKRGNAIAQAPPTLPLGLPGRQPAPLESAAVVPSAEPADTASETPDPQTAESPATPPTYSPETPATPAVQEKPEPAPADKPADAEPSQEPPADEPALPPTAPPSDAAPAAKPDAPSLEPKDESLDSLLKDDQDATDPTAKPEEMPADQPTDEKLPEPAKGAEPSPDAAGEPDPFENLDQGAPQAEKPAAPAEAIGLRNPRPVTPGELTTALQNFSEADRKMTAAEMADGKTDPKKLRAGYFLSLYRLADALTLAKSEPLGGEFDASRQGAHDRALELAADPTRLKELKSYGSKWLAFAKRTTDGVALAGTVQSAEQVGKLYEVKLELAADAPSVTLVSSVDPGLAGGDEVVALGTIVDRPREQLSGYEGSEVAVVWSGLALKVPSVEK